MRHRLTRWGAFGVAVALLAGCSTTSKPAATPETTSSAPPRYSYTIVDPLAATVVGTPAPLRADVPDDINISELDLTVFEDREFPSVFWYANTLRYSLVYQDHAAPLIFLVAGTGAGHNSGKMRFLQKAFYQGGFHVISLPSPTYLDFIVSGSTTSVPGRAEDDARDLYQAMQLAYEEVKDRIEVTKFHLSGYSLGGWNAAFIAKQDETEQVFDFEKVLLINPPVSLYNSVSILDNMLTDNVPGGIDNLHVFFEDFVNQIADLYVESDAVDFTGEELLYRLYTETEPGEEELAALIGMAFRLSSTNMLFTADVMNNFGYIVPKNLQLGASSSTTPFFQAGTRVSFVQYFNEVYVPYFQSKQADLTRQDLIDQASLESIEDYLVGATKIGLSTNEDDIILAPGEIEYLAQIFGPRAKIFPTGGHMGNLEERSVTAHIVGFFKS